MTKQSRRKSSKNNRLPLDVISSKNQEMLSRVPGMRTKRTLSSTGTITLVPSAGFVLTGISSSYVIGVYANCNGFSVYNTTAGVGAKVDYGFSNNTNYNAIFDQYRISTVRISGYFQNNSSSTSSITTGMPIFYTSVDFDANSTTTAQDLLSFSTTQITQASSLGAPAFVRTFQPRTIQTLNSGVLATQFAGISPPNTWIDTNTPTAPHFGLAIGYEPGSASSITSIGALVLIVDLEIEYRGTK